ncbi:P-loop containing nucleoside triphosphate hydrolase protein [Chlamydoabsidia padenii]|nr:P-loop containing nucleoside triphosphate hydrolase protein [Chlamydoabsidia padenii]
MFPEGSLKDFFVGLQPLLPSLLNEVFWEQLFGTKSVAILKLLLSNETLLLSGSVFFGPSFATYITSVYHSIRNYITNQLYVAVEVDDMERIHRPIAAFVSEQMETLDLRSAQGQYDRRKYDSSHWSTLSNTNPSIALQPVLDSQQQFTYKGRTFWVVRLSEKNSNNVSSDGSAFSRLFNGGALQKSSTRITMRGRDIKELRSYMQEWIDLYYAKKDNKLVVYKCSHSGRPGDCSWEEKVTKDIRSFDTVILKEGQKEDLLQDVKDFLNKQEWYADRGIPYRHGCLLSGPPGCGKTSIVRSITSELGMQLASINLTGMNSDEEFENMVADAPGNSILLLEDVDHCLKVISDSKESNKSSPTGNGHITLPGLLNVMDGLDMRDGTIFFMTCNDINVLPPVMRRRGRIDKEIVLDYANEYQVRMMFERFFRKPYFDDKTDDDWQKTCDKVAKALPPGEFSTAELQGFFLDYTFYMERQSRVDGLFDDLFDRIDAFKLETRKNRQDREDQKNAVLEELKKKQKKKQEKGRGNKKTASSAPSPVSLSSSSSSSSDDDDS